MDDLIDNDTLLNELLSSNLGDISTSSSNAAAVKKAKYSELSAIGNLTSYSMQQVWKRCPREFQIMKLSADVNGEDERESNTDFAFGHAIGAGVATYDQTKSRQQAIWAAFLAWDIDLFEEKQKRENRPVPNKSFHHAIWALYQYETFFKEETDLEEYDFLKAEETVGVDFENGHFYIGHIDERLQHKVSGKFLIKENKTTGFASVDPAIYANSDQALSYAIVTDAVGDSEYEVLYTIYSSTEQRWLQFSFIKSALQKAEWLKGQTFIHSGIDLSSDHDFFPKNGDACVRYGRRCEYYESCDFDGQRVFGKTFAGLRKISSLQEIEAIETVDHKYTWTQLLQSQKDKL